MDKEIRGQIEAAAEQFRAMLTEQYERNARMAARRKAAKDADDSEAVSGGAGKTVIGLAAGD
ncbi:MAG: hypothetical protein IJ227_00835, partial [Mogibacterium sp.]|nr:hypothetical protein [Mogibacterium sp.]